MNKLLFSALCIVLVSITLMGSIIIPYSIIKDESSKGIFDLVQVVIDPSNLISLDESKYCVIQVYEDTTTNIVYNSYIEFSNKVVNSLTNIYN